MTDVNEPTYRLELVMTEADLAARLFNDENEALSDRTERTYGPNLIRDYGAVASFSLIRPAIPATPASIRGIGLAP
jgi:hypothetical protein